MALDDYITIDYYTRALSWDIAVLVKREAKLTLIEKFARTLEVEKDLLSIGALENDSRDEAKLPTKKNQASTSKLVDKDKYYFYFEGFSKYLKQITNEVSKLID